MARKITGLTNTQVERAKYDPNGKNELNDGNGLFLQLMTAGSKIWRFRYNHPTTNKRTKITIGNYPEISIAQARQWREEYRALLAQGIDPKTHKEKIAREQELAEANTFLAVAEKWRDKKRGEITEKTLAKYWGSLNLHIFPFIGRYPVAEIVPTLVISPLQRVEQRNNVDMANRLAGYVNEILNFAVNGGLIPFNPCAKVAQALKKHKKQNNPHIGIEEIPQFMQDLANANIETQTRWLIQFQMLTMTRAGEASGARWDEIDFKKKLWIIPAERMKAREAHAIPLSIQVVILLKRLYSINGRFDYVFLKRGDNHAPMNPSSINVAIKRFGYGGRQTAHGFRGLARTWLAENGVNFEIGEACLSHRVGSAVAKAYNHASYLAQRKAIMQQWADFIEQCSAGSLPESHLKIVNS